MPNSWDSMESSLDLWVSKPETSGCRMAKSASKDSLVSMKPNKRDSLPGTWGLSDCKKATTANMKSLASSLEMSDCSSVTWANSEARSVSKLCWSGCKMDLSGNMTDSPMLQERNSGCSANMMEKPMANAGNTATCRLVSLEIQDSATSSATFQKRLIAPMARSSDRPASFRW